MHAMTDDEVSALHKLQREILSYLAQHPDAKDTVEGIVQWWLPREDTRMKVSHVSSALEGLVERGWMTASGLGQGARVYGLNHARQNEIRKWLEN
jgi:hypothetical protein